VGDLSLAECCAPRDALLRRCDWCAASSSFEFFACFGAQRGCIFCAGLSAFIDWAHRRFGSI
jgi:hypothetical protein